MSRNASALRVDFDTPEAVSEVYSDPLPTDGDDEFVDHEDDDVMFMIEQEYCFASATGTHVYLGDSNRCYACGAAHPSIRNACGQR